MRPGDVADRDAVVKKLVEIQYQRNDIDFHRGTFRVRGDVLEIFPSYSSDKCIRVEFFGDEIEKISEIEAVSGRTLATLLHCFIFPASHYVVNGLTMEKSIENIRRDMLDETAALEKRGKAIEAYRMSALLTT